MGSPSWSLQRLIHQNAHCCSRVKTGFSAHLQTSRRGIHLSPICKSAPFFQHHFLIFFLEVLFSFLSRCGCGFGQSCPGMISIPRRWGNNPNEMFISLSFLFFVFFLDRIGTETGRGKVCANRSLSGNKPGDLKSCAHEIGCPNIKWCAGVEAALDPAINRKHMSMETIVYILRCPQRTLLFSLFPLSK